MKTKKQVKKQYMRAWDSRKPWCELGVLQTQLTAYPTFPVTPPLTLEVLHLAPAQFLD